MMRALHRAENRAWAGEGRISGVEFKFKYRGTLPSDEIRKSLNFERDISKRFLRFGIKFAVKALAVLLYHRACRHRQLTIFGDTC